MRRTRKKERGAALIVVMLLMVTMATLAIAMQGKTIFGVKRAINISLHQQASWYALGAETLARQVIYADWFQNTERSTLNDGWARQDLAFALEGGGLQGVIRDGSNCFNLNSLVDGTPGDYGPNAEARKRFAALLAALDIYDAEARELASAATDWIDTDAAPGPGGAEDFYYTALTPPYRTGGDLMADPSELRAVKGFDEEIYARIRPFLCALPVATETVLNINTLTPSDAPLLVMMMPEALNLLDAEALIEARPEAGFSSIEEFWTAPIFEGKPIDQDVRDLLGQRTQYFRLTAGVSYQGMFFELHSTLEQRSTGDIRVVSRRYGAVE